MKFSLFKSLYSEAMGYDDFELYVSERGWQDWMNEYDSDRIADTLETIYYLAKHSLSEVREKIGMSRRAFSAWSGIPSRTLENWDANINRKTDYMDVFTAFIVFSEGFLDEQD